MFHSFALYRCAWTPNTAPVGSAEIEADAGAVDKVAEFLPNAVERYQKLVGDLEKISQQDVPRAREQI